MRRVRCKAVKPDGRVCNTLHNPNEECWDCVGRKRDAEIIKRINSEPHMFPVREGLLPSGRRVKFAYHGVPGIWCTDELGQSWCGIHCLIPVNSEAGRAALAQVEELKKQGKW